MSKIEPFFIVSDGKYKLGHSIFSSSRVLGLAQDTNTIKDSLYESIEESDLESKLFLIFKSSNRNFKRMGGLTHGTKEIEKIFYICNDPQHVLLMGKQYQKYLQQALFYIRYTKPQYLLTLTDKFKIFVRDNSQNIGLFLCMASNKIFLNESPLFCFTILLELSEMTEGTSLFTKELLDRINYAFTYQRAIRETRQHLNGQETYNPATRTGSNYHVFMQGLTPESKIIRDTTLYKLHACYADLAFDDFQENVASQLNYSSDDLFILRAIFRAKNETDESIYKLEKILYKKINRVTNSPNKHLDIREAYSLAEMYL
jgi:hypothetical protein